MPKNLKHPFEITCKNCGSHKVRISAEDWNDIEIKCETCGTYTNCGNDELVKTPFCPQCGAIYAKDEGIDEL